MHVLCDLLKENVLMYLMSHVSISNTVIKLRILCNSAITSGIPQIEPHMF